MELEWRNVPMMNVTTRTPATMSGVRSTSRLRAGRLGGIHNQPTTGLRVKSRVKAGFHFVATQSKSSPNHNQAVKGIRVKSRVRAGGIKLTDILVSG
jgi:hypothetical protein